MGCERRTREKSQLSLSNHYIFTLAGVLRWATAKSTCTAVLACISLSGSSQHQLVNLR